MIKLHCPYQKISSQSFDRVCIYESVKLEGDDGCYMHQ